MPLFVFDGATLPKRLLLGVGIGTTEGSDYLLLSITGSPSGGISGLTSGSIPYADSNGQLIEDNANLFYDSLNKQVFIGSKLPKTGFTANLQITRANTAPGITIFEYSTGSILPSFVTLVANKGTETIPLALLSGDSLGRINFTGYYGQSYPLNSPARFEVITASNWVTGSYGSYFSFQNVLTGTSTLREIARLNYDGSLIISGSITVGGSSLITSSETVKGGLNLGTAVSAAVGEIRSTLLTAYNGGPTNNSFQSWSGTLVSTGTVALNGLGSMIMVRETSGNAQEIVMTTYGGSATAIVGSFLNLNTDAGTTWALFLNGGVWTLKNRTAGTAGYSVWQISI